MCSKTLRNQEASIRVQIVYIEREKVQINEVSLLLTMTSNNGQKAGWDFFSPRLPKSSCFDMGR